MSPRAPAMTAEPAKRGLVGQRMAAAESVALEPPGLAGLKARGRRGLGTAPAGLVPAALAVRPAGAADATVRRWLPEMDRGPVRRWVPVREGRPPRAARGAGAWWGLPVWAESERVPGMLAPGPHPRLSGSAENDSPSVGQALVDHRWWLPRGPGRRVWAEKRQRWPRRSVRPRHTAAVRGVSAGLGRSYNRPVPRAALAMG